MQSGTSLKAYAHTDLKPGRKYAYQVIAYDTKGGKRVKTESLSATVARVFNVKATATSTSAIKVTWSKLGGVTGYKLYYKKHSASKWSGPKVLTGAKSKTKTVTGLTSNTKYDFKVVAYKTVKKVTTTFKTSAVVSTKTKMTKKEADAAYLPWQTIDAVRDDIQAAIDTKWGGSCFGMSTTIALNKLGQINVRAYTGSSGTGSHLNKVSKPKDSARVKSLINYYQIGQCCPLNSYAYIEKQYVSRAEWKSALTTLTADAKAKKLQVFGFWFEDKSGHAILVKGYAGIITDGNKTEWHRLSTYDPSYPNASKYVLVKKDYSAIKVEGYKPIAAILSAVDLREFEKLNIEK
ncbi:MAG: fibronectin type III domain-containing protein [Actinomycetes bacterium]|jgi:hypothetical protein|nr:fibronectin type III domain-containing protein [Actinomycetes bacterium]